MGTDRIEGFLIGLSVGFLVACVLKHRYDTRDSARDPVREIEVLRPHAVAAAS